MNDIQLFNYDEAAVRIIMKDGQAWWVAKDVCEILGYSNPRKALADHLDDDEKDVTNCYTLGGNQNMNVINESGLYCLILRSNMPKAKEFRKWITTTVLPQIRETGSYSPIGGEKLTKSILYAARMIFEAAGIKDNQLALALDKVAAHYTGQSMLALSGITLVAPTKCQLLTPSEIGKHFGVSARKVNKMLIDAEYQKKVGKNYEPLELGEPFAVMVDTGKAHSDGTPVRQLKWESSFLGEIAELFEEGSLFAKARASALRLLPAVR